MNVVLAYWIACSKKLTLQKFASHFLKEIYKGKKTNTNFAIAIAKTADEKRMLHARAHNFHMTTKTKIVHVKCSRFDPINYSCTDR